MPKFKNNPNPIMKKQAFGEGKSPFSMKYKNSAFPFKSPIKKSYKITDMEELQRTSDYSEEELIKLSKKLGTHTTADDAIEEEI